MTRGFWLGVMLASVLLTTGAAFFVVEYLDIQQATHVPLEPVDAASMEKTDSDPDAEADASSEVGEGGDADALRADLTGGATAAAAVAPPPPPVSTVQDVVFSLNRPTARQVFLIADFTKWYRRPLSKKGGAWEISMPLEPGTYRYLFVVDGRRITDPGNRKVEDGKSILVVTPGAGN